MQLIDRILGRPLASAEEDEQKIGPAAGIPLLGLDALSSAAYGPEAAMTILLPLGLLGVHYLGSVMSIVVGLLVLLYFSYRQTISAYPGGGGSYTVARENLGQQFGLIAASSLLVDYLLNVCVGIAAGVGALVSAFPSLHTHILQICLAILFLLAYINLRGVREAGAAFMAPTYLFVATIAATLVIGVVKTILSGGHPHAVSTPPAIPVATASVSLWLLMRSFASGCTAMTGVEAISNGVTAFAKPTVKNAQTTLTAIVVILGLLLVSIAYLCSVYHIGATDPESANYQSVLSMLVAAVMGRGVIYYITIGSVLAVLALSANTSFAGVPRLCRLLAEDDFLPHSFANRGRRLVYTMGIVILTLLSALILIIFHGITDRLIPLFAVGAFGAFSLSQAGMVVHWLRHPGTTSTERARTRVAMVINGLGAIGTTAALIVVLVAKFMDGAWITLLIIPALLTIFQGVHRHYRFVEKETCDPGPLQLEDMSPPIVVIPVKDWSTVSERAVRFGLKISNDVIAVFVSTTEEEAEHQREIWTAEVDPPCRFAGRPAPRLEVISSPYRRLFTPLLEFILKLEAENPTRQIAVVIPELVESRWYQYLLHNQRATGLKAALLLKGGPRVVVINVPWYLGRHGPR